jgi:hypothetical protein
MAWCGLSIQYACRNTYLILKSDPTGKTQRVLNAKLLLLSARLRMTSYTAVMDYLRVSMVYRKSINRKFH